MNKENTYSKIMQSKTDLELHKIIDNKLDYTNEALQATLWELEKREALLDDEILLLKQIEVLPVQKNKTVEDAQANGSVNSTDLPILFSKQAIFGFTILFSTIFGVVLMMYNFRKMNLPKSRSQVLFFGIIFTILNFFIIDYLPKSVFTSLAANVIGYLILVEYFWNFALGKELKYEKKSIKKPLMISLFAAVIIVLLQFLMISGQQ